MGYGKRDHDIVDYQMYCLRGTKERFRGPSPQNLEKGQYFVCLGAAQTFGRFCPRPYPNILGKRLNLSVLNLSTGGAIPDWFLQRRVLFDYINDAKFVIIQVMSARTVSNSLFKSNLSGSKIIRKDTNVALTADEAYEQLIKIGDKEKISKIVAETRQNWVNSYKFLLAEIKVPKILLWFSKRKPQYQVDFEKLEFGWQLFKDFPQMVNMDMIDQIKLNCDQYIECISDGGLPQLLVNRFTGESVVNTNGQGIQKTHNNYYPSPEMHKDVAKVLEKVCVKYSQVSSPVFLDKKEKTKKTLVIFSIPRTGSTFICNVINSLEEFECFGEVFHPNKVHIPWQRKLKLWEYIENQQEFNFQLNKEETFQNRKMLKIAHEFPNLFLSSIKNTSKSKYLGFKIFPNHLDLVTVKNILLDDENTIKVILKRNVLESYSSIKIANKIKQYNSMNTSDIKIFFKENAFDDWMQKNNSFYSFIEKHAKKSSQKYLFLDYETINQYESDQEKAIFIVDFLKKAGFEISEYKNFENFSFITKQDSRTNILERFKNPYKVTSFLEKRHLEHLLL